MFANLHVHKNYLESLWNYVNSWLFKDNKEKQETRFFKSSWGILEQLFQTSYFEKHGFKA